MRLLLRHPVPLALIACVLTLAASGDDLNLVRLVFPGAFSGVPVGAFPDDDDNTDFTPSPRPWGLDGGRARRECAPIAAGCLLQTAGSCPCALGPPGATGRPGAPLGSRLSFTPLRC